MTGVAFGNRGRSINTTKGAQLENKAFLVQLRQAFTLDFAVVKSFNFTAQTVDVELLAENTSQEFRGVPIMFSGGPVRFGWPLKAGDVGILAFPRLRSDRALETNERRPKREGRTHSPVEPVFIPSVPFLSQTPTANLSEEPASHQAGPNDFFVLNESGYGFIIKENGRMSFRAEGFDFFGPNDDAGDLKTVDTVGLGDSTVMRST